MPSTPPQPVIKCGYPVRVPSAADQKACAVLRHGVLVSRLIA